MKLQESLKHMKSELVSTFKLFGLAIDEKPSKQRGKREEQSVEYRMAKGAGQVRKIEMQIFQVRNKGESGETLNDVKEEGMGQAIALNQKLSIVNKA